jgi:Zn-dependent peptidase ImmA (M78 family)
MLPLVTSKVLVTGQDRHGISRLPLSPPQSGPRNELEEPEFQANIVRLIAIERKPEDALEALCEHYRVERPVLRIGLPRGEKKALGCYVHRERTIYISSEEYLFDPYVLIHEFYHHLRHVDGKHRGTERHARDFALAFLRNAQRAR